MNKSNWDTSEVREEGYKEWKRKYPNSSNIRFRVYPKRCNEFILRQHQEQELTKKTILFHGSPVECDTLIPQHDYYGKRMWAAISCTTDAYYALAFGLINRKMKDSSKVILYKFKGEGILAEYQIGKLVTGNAREVIEKSNAFDVLHEVKHFHHKVFQVENYHYDQDHIWIKEILKGQINIDRKKELIEKIKFYLVNPNQISTL